MAKKTRRHKLGLGATRESALSWLNSATKIFESRQKRDKARPDLACDDIEHYTDAAAEATAAAVLAPEGSAIATRADNLRWMAIDAQRQAVQVCRRQAVTNTRQGKR